jgi:hypothetical protein
MMGFHHTPRTGALEVDMPDVLAVALARLRKCNPDTLDVFVLIEELPDLILPALAWAASRRAYIPRDTVRILVKACGPLFLERCLGGQRARELIARYPDKQTVSGL